MTWDNRDGTRTVTAEDRSWDSGTFDDGGSFRHTFRAAGTYDYLCLLHPEMTGTVAPTGAPDGTSAEGPAGAQTIAIRGSAFAPAATRVVRGGSVTWTNRGEAVHNVASVGDGPLGSALLEPGGRTAPASTSSAPSTPAATCTPP